MEIRASRLQSVNDAYNDIFDAFEKKFIWSTPKVDGLFMDGAKEV